ncbi:P-type conjugative transfer protein VirB9 [Aggregatibacter actinomycetemcomitans]|uniref:P-type conjugative transfer protein VirB9 n=1 Tax=Aggregatibacter actinomycetemcomitans TaxID=714 RepID=UPI00197C7081|nr:P-type conjugative transfer protein VirB9 [Aggregatibacter actinomycetemcomitans]MBN6059383.1 P-type conjugative transfer protein VirB9 [Aggregatibacter actinomycetemcomitans]MBN6087884.1 P-type conjugative transfer protein VirB9 [Aggregatibacter actinomycetemcomitans]
MQKIISLLCVALSLNAFAASNPMKSRFDDRIQSQVYNALDVTKVHIKEGNSSVIALAEDEQVSIMHVGFKDAWNIEQKGRFILITPTALRQQTDGGEEIIDPTPGEWDTNLFVNTNKRTYSFDLILVREKETPAYQVNFSYPEEKQKKQAESRKNAANAREQQEIKKLLHATSTPKNWNFMMKVKAGSETITPDYAYDDGLFTYLGFAPTKTFPAAFLREGETESLLNTSVKQDGKYQVLVIQKTAERIILRSGEKVVGIYNQSYGKTPVAYNTTISPNVARDER